MYLKALEIQGFKSFADKTRLTFEKDITAIVGPNGSGKSNISDAILWVMGEQRTKALRGNKMEDVIFGGTEVRSPMGFAQVSLILDNSGYLFETEGSELMLTRRYYRSGESEYYINKEPVRLKDINGLLMDTGLGRDGYSIIGQGKIADIISTKSADRREVFEEAAGISRYRFRKEEAERKLEKTEENLVRINDKIEELELQVGPLKEQSEKAKKYLVLRDDLRIKEISVWLATLDKLRSQSEAIRQEYETIRERKNLEDYYFQQMHGMVSGRVDRKDVFRNIHKFGIENGMVYLFEEPLHYEYGLDFGYPDYVNLKCTIKSGEVYLLPGERQRRAIREIFSENEMFPRCKGIMVLPIYYGKELYGLLICEHIGNICDRGEFVAGQLSAALKIAEKE